MQKLSIIKFKPKQGCLDKKLASLVNKKVCTQIVENLNLGKYILLSGSQKKK